MSGIQKEMSRRPRNRNQYLYIRSIGPGCWGTCPTATQGGEWRSHKISRAALWTSSASTARRRRPRWIICPSELFLEDQKWRNCRERGLDCMESDREPPIWISARVLWLCWPYEALHCRGAEWPYGCWNHSLLHNDMSPVCTFQTPDRFFLNAPNRLFLMPLIFYGIYIYIYINNYYSSM